MKMGYNAEHFILGPSTCENDECEEIATHGVKLETPIGLAYTVGLYCRTHAIAVEEELNA